MKKLPSHDNRPARKIRVWKGYVVRGWNAYGKAVAAIEMTSKREAEEEHHAMTNSGMYSHVTLHFEHVAGGRTMLQTWMRGPRGFERREGESPKK